MEDTHKSQFGRMFTELLARHRAKTSEQSSKRSGKSAKEAIAFLDLRKTGQGGRDGPAPVTSWEIIPLSLGEDLMLNFGGVAQRRKRVFLVLDLGGQCAGRILFERTGLRRNFKEVRRTGKTLRPSVEASSFEHDCVYAVENHAQDGRATLRADGIIQTLAGRMGTGGGMCLSSSFGNMGRSHLRRI